MTAPLPPELDVQSVKQLLDGGDPLLLLDCREHDEYQYVRLPGSRHIPLGDISGRLSELRDYQDQRIVVYCHHGGRSQMVTEFLRQQGFTHAQNMSGGIDAWATQIDTGLKRY